MLGIGSCHMCDCVSVTLCHYVISKYCSLCNFATHICLIQKSNQFLLLLDISVLPDYLSVRVAAEAVLKFNTAVLRCQVPQSAASYTKIVSWTRGSSRLYPSSRGGKIFMWSRLKLG